MHMTDEVWNDLDKQGDNDSGLGFGVNFIAMHLYVVSMGAATHYMMVLKHIMFTLLPSNNQVYNRCPPTCQALVLED
jgi:hypothetical protein